MRRLFLYILLIVCFLNPLSAHAGDDSCTQDKRVVAPCFDVSGRLSIYANLRPYLHAQKTKKILGVALASDLPDADYMWPTSIKQAIDPGTNIFGDFRVCPFTLAQTGVQQLVCIASASNVRVRTSHGQKTISAAAFHLPATSEEKFLDKTLRDADQDDAVTPWLFDSIISKKETARKIVAHFSTGFISALQKKEQSEIDEKCQGHMIEGELCGLEYSPLVCSQEDNDYHFVYQTVSSDKKEILISMRWDVPNSPEPMATYKLKKIRGHWQIDGISCTGREAFNMSLIQ